MKTAQAGEYTDAETGFVYLRARYYDPATGQFLTRDPIEALTREPYAYVYGNPLNFTDPSGLVTLRGVLRGVAVVSGFAAAFTPVGGFAVAAMTVSMLASTGAAISDRRAHGGRCGPECQLDVFNVIATGVLGPLALLRPAAKTLQRISQLVYLGGLAASGATPAEASVSSTRNGGGCLDERSFRVTELL